MESLGEIAYKNIRSKNGVEYIPSPVRHEYEEKYKANKKSAKVITNFIGNIPAKKQRAALLSKWNNDVETFIQTRDIYNLSNIAAMWFDVAIHANIAKESLGIIIQNMERDGFIMFYRSYEGYLIEGGSDKYLNVLQFNRDLQKEGSDIIPRAKNMLIKSIEIDPGEFEDTFSELNSLDYGAKGIHVLLKKMPAPMLKKYYKSALILFPELGMKPDVASGTSKRKTSSKKPPIKTKNKKQKTKTKRKIPKKRKS
jgi:hypothetical protein